MTAAGTGPDPFAGIAELGDELFRLQRHRATVYDGVLLESSAFRLLWALRDGEPRTLRRLAEHLDLEQSTINRQAHAAIDGGYLERFEVEGNASKLLRPTPAGRAAYEHDGLIRAARFHRVLARLGPDRAASLVADLAAFNDAWDATVAPEAPGHPLG